MLGRERETYPARSPDCRTIPTSAPKETPQCQVPSGAPSNDSLCSSMNSEDQNKELSSNQVHLEDTSKEVPSKLEAELRSSKFGSPELHSTDLLWILPENTPRDLSSTHGNSADLDPLSSSLPSASPLDKDSGFNLIESGDSQGCGDNPATASNRAREESSPPAPRTRAFRYSSGSTRLGSHHASYLTRGISSTRTTLTSNTTKKAHTHTTKTHRKYFFLFFLARSRLLILPTLELSILLLHSSLSLLQLWNLLWTCWSYICGTWAAAASSSSLQLVRIL